jgi:hypothetical protein
MKIAMQWGQILDADKLRVALEALEPQLKREHQLRVKQLASICQRGSVADLLGSSPVMSSGRSRWAVA